MSKSSSSLRRRLHRRSKSAALAVLTTAVAAAGLAAAPTASSAPSTDCPLAYPVADVAKGQQVNGRTVTSGTEPTAFSGQVLGVIRDGIAPGLDMVMARLSSPEIDRVGGIWQGMSGSPVYAADGRLIGAVSYGLSWGPSTVAGITPAEEMYRLLEEAPTDPAAQTTLRMAASDDTVEVPAPMLSRVAAAGDVSEEEAQEGMSRLPLPFGISGMANGKRLNQAKKAFDLKGVRVYQSGAAATTADAELPIVPGGNLAASIAYGDLSAVGVGTATAVCGDQVVGFGHPMMWSGPSQLSMHGADALYVQEESLGAPFKIANPAAPVGGISQDRRAGIFGLQSGAAVPDTAEVTSYVEVPGEWSRTGTSRISVPDAVPDMAAFHMLVDQDRVFDAVGTGSAKVGWTVTGKRADGRTFTFSRTDRFASEWDISFETIWDLYDQLARIYFNDLEDVTLEKISTTSTMEREYLAYKITKVRVLVGGRWQDLRTDKPLVLRPGKVKRFRVLLSSAELGKTVIPVALQVPERMGRRSGYLEILGGNSYWGEDMGYFEEGPYMSADTGPQTFEGLLNKLSTAPRNDQVLANLSIYRRAGVMRRSGRGQAAAVVNGGVSVEVISSLSRRARR
ncbi:MAG TPA: SpoIVB peptidase S55 domain-containing protein [Nocardioidaceae bacterium]|nr:SpoIVB peptidase S55 domain-containing protein [Nocardioidaceae bacterium]